MLNKNFVTLRDAFHPEAAQAVLMTPQQQHNNRWGIVWAEATLIDDESSSSTTSSQQQRQTSPYALEENGFPDEKAVQVVYDEEQPADSLQQHDASTTMIPAKDIASQSQPPLSPWSHGHFFDLLLGTVITVTATSSIFAVDLCALLVYSLACGFHAICAVSASNRIMCALLWPLFKPLELSLFLVDILLLGVSVLLAETLAGVAWLLCLIFGGCKVAGLWHQYIRRMCHLTRWAFRGFQPTAGEGGEISVTFPPRGYPFLNSTSRKEQIDCSEGSADSTTQLELSDVVVATPVHDASAPPKALLR